MNHEDVPEELRSTSAPPKENDYDTDDNHFKRWEWILNEMIWAFAQKLDDDAESQFHSGKHDTHWRKVNIKGEPVGDKTYEFNEKFDDEDDDSFYYEMVKGPNDTHVFDKLLPKFYYRPYLNHVTQWYASISPPQQLFLYLLLLYGYHLKLFP